MAKNRENTHSLTNTIIGKGSVLEGDFQIENDITIYATLKGELVCTGTVVVGESGYLEANMRVKDIVIAGKVLGNLEASEKVVLKSNAVLIGDLRTRLLVVEEGAVFQGKCDSGAEVERSKRDQEEKGKLAVLKQDESQKAMGK